MKYTPTPLPGAFTIDIEPIADDRGFFSYLLDAREAESHGVDPKLAQAKVAYNHRKGTLRGMHFQVAPSMESKLLRCTRGAVMDIIVDVRPDSPTYLKHFAVELSADNRRSLYVPPMFAHGYQTLTDSTEVIYHVNEFYAPKHERGLRYDDPRLGLSWPLPVSLVSPKDLSWPTL